MLLAAAACAARRPATEEALPAPPLARAALAEWEAWGGIVVTGWPEVRPADTAATPARFARLLEYWAAVPGGESVARGLFGRRAALAASLEEQGSADAQEDGAEGEPVPAGRVPLAVEDIGLYARPAWSAAFIAAVARRAGLPETDLPSSATHARYIDALLMRAFSDPDTAPFLPHAPEEHAPKPGDLLCFDRSGLPLSHWSERLAELGRFRPMHCDVVVRSGEQFVDAIGGNVEDLVVLRRLPADEQGHVLPSPPGKPVALLVLAARQGR